MSIGHFHLQTFIVMLWNKVRKTIITLNLFENVNKPQPPEEELRTQRRWTRVYLLILILTLTIITIYTAFTYQTQVIPVSNPTLNDYKNFKQSVDCSCTNLSIPYEIFIDLNVSFHKICSSTFINQHSNWTTMLYSAFSHQVNITDNITTFQRMALPHFQALKTMCEIVNQIINNEISLFLNSTFISTRMVDFNIFYQQINAILDDFKSNIVSSNFLLSFQLIRGMYVGNSLISAYGTN